MSRARSEKIIVTRRDGVGKAGRVQDEVVVEEPMSIRLDGELVATTMRTPGDDFELAVGFCHNEGLFAGAPLLGCRYCGSGPAVLTDFNVVDVDTGGRAPAPTPRLTAITASCGLCGSADIDDLAERLAPLPASAAPDVAQLAELPSLLREAQLLFDRTGGVHAAAAMNIDGSDPLVREDVGRHNAVDKVCGRLLLDGRLPATGRVLVVSSRASFEIVQKAWASGFAALVVVSAPTSLAVHAARRAGLTLVGFARHDGCNVYTTPDPVEIEH